MGTWLDFHKWYPIQRVSVYVQGFIHVFDILGPFELQRHRVALGPQSRCIT